MSYARVKWLAIGLPAALVGLFEFARHRWLAHRLEDVWGDALAALVVGLAVSAFVRYFTGVVARAERALGRSRAEAAVLVERQRIGREMHDGIAQALFLARVRVKEADEQLGRGDRAAAHERLRAVHGQLASADEQLRAAIADLKRASTVEDTVEALRREVGPVAEALGIELTVAADDLPRLDAQGRQHLTAIVSEALSNAARHGGATRVVLDGAPTRLAITDNGRGLPPDGHRGSGFGLEIMGERARLIGGTLGIEPGDGQGARVVLVWPGALR